MLLLFLALTFLSSLLVPIGSPLQPVPGSPFRPRLGRDTCLLCLRDSGRGRQGSTARTLRLYVPPQELP